MAADRQRLAAALAYEEERRRRMMESVPGLVTTPAQPAPRADFRTNLENLSIGLGRGVTTGLEGVKGIITDPVGTAKSVYEAGRAVIRDPSVIADALRYTAQKATSGPLGAGEVIGEMLGPRKGGPMMQELDVYHGTPHRFPATEANPLGEFDASKIGTGEGAQAYGHGVYYAENPEVAKGYQPRDPKAEAKLMNLYKQAEARQNYDAMEVLEAAMLHRTASELREQYPNQKALVNRIGKINEKAAGALYKADLPDEMIDRMLDYDKPLTQQPKNIQAALAKLGDPQEKLDAYDDALLKALFEDAADPGAVPKNPLGADILKKLENQYGRKGASDYLSGLGIPGIRYLDAGSRGQGGSGTRNFVVFPGEEKKVRILERDGQKAPPQKIAQALETTPKNQNLVDVFNKTAKREIELANKRIVDPDEVYLTHQPITNLEELDQITDPLLNYAKASVLKKIGEQNGFNVKLEGSNVSPSVYAKFTKVDDSGVTDFKVRISDHADVSRNKPMGEKKAYDINPDSNGSMQEIIKLLNDSSWLKQFYELD